jgi:hypothetical protein
MMNSGAICDQLAIRDILTLSALTVRPPSSCVTAGPEPAHGVAGGYRLHKRRGACQVLLHFLAQGHLLDRLKAMTPPTRGHDAALGLPVQHG